MQRSFCMEGVFNARTGRAHGSVAPCTWELCSCTGAMSCLVVGMGCLLQCCEKKWGQERGWSVLQKQKHGPKPSGWSPHSPCSSLSALHDALEAFPALTRVCCVYSCLWTVVPCFFQMVYCDFWTVILWEILYLNTVTKMSVPLFSAATILIFTWDYFWNSCPHLCLIFLIVQPWDFFRCCVKNCYNWRGCEKQEPPVSHCSHQDEKRN